MEMRLGKIELTTPKTQARRMNMVLWGPSGAGKTTLAATAPRPILWVNFDIDGTSSLMDQEDIFIADYSKENPNVVATFKREDTASIKGLLRTILRLRLWCLILSLRLTRWLLDLVSQRSVEQLWKLPLSKGMVDETPTLCRELLLCSKRLDHTINTVYSLHTKTYPRRTKSQAK